MLLNCFIGFHPSYPASDSIKWKGAATQARGQSIAEDKVICFFLFYLPRISLNYGATTTIACVKNFFLFFLFSFVAQVQSWSRSVCIWFSCLNGSESWHCSGQLPEEFITSSCVTRPTACVGVSSPLNLYSACRCKSKLAQSDRRLGSQLFSLFETAFLGRGMWATQRRLNGAESLLRKKKKICIGKGI